MASLWHRASAKSWSEQNKSSPGAVRAKSGNAADPTVHTKHLWQHDNYTL